MNEQMDQDNGANVFNWMLGGAPNPQTLPIAQAEGRVHRIADDE